MAKHHRSSDVSSRNDVSSSDDVLNGDGVSPRRLGVLHRPPDILQGAFESTRLSGTVCDEDSEQGSSQNEALHHNLQRVPEMCQHIARSELSSRRLRSEARQLAMLAVPRIRGSRGTPARNDRLRVSARRAVRTKTRRFAVERNTLPENRRSTSGAPFCHCSEAMSQKMQSVKPMPAASSCERGSSSGLSTGAALAPRGLD
jgi:hypothetical protein